MNYNDIEDQVDHMTHRDSGNGRAIAGFLIGAGVGILAGVLLAPQSGKETMDKVGARSGDWRNQLGGMLDHLTKMVNDYVEQGKTAVQNGAQRDKEVIG